MPLFMRFYNILLIEISDSLPLKTNIFDSKTIILPLKTLYYLALKPVLFCAKNHSLH